MRVRITSATPALAPESPAMAAGTESFVLEGLRLGVRSAVGAQR